MAYRILTNGELTKDAVTNVLDGLKSIEQDSKGQSPSNATSTTTTTPEKKEVVNGVNGTTLNFDQFCCIMSELLQHHYRSSARSLSNLLSNKANYFVQSVSLALTKLLGKFTAKTWTNVLLIGQMCLDKTQV